MGEQLGAGGVPGAPSAHGLPDIAAAKALVWNVELERGLRVTRPGAPIEAILKTGPRMLWWNEEPISSAETAALYKLVDGQDKTFANAMLQRLADSFRTGNNLTRLCIVKAFLLVSKSRASGLFKKERIANHQEVLKRVKSVMDSGDVVARALALRMLGCLGEIAAHSVDVHRLVIEALESPHHKEVDAALFATGCLCELSPNFAQVAFERVVDMANAMGSSPATKLAAIRVFSKFGVSPRLSLEAHEAGESLLLRLPTTEIVSAMLTSLTALALKSTVTSERQVELLFAYVSSDPRATVRAVALQNLSKSARLSARTRVSSKWSFSVLLSVAEDSVAAPALRVLAFQVLHKLSGHFVKVVARTELFRFLLTMESNFLSYPWPLRQTALECLGSFGCNLKPRDEDERILREGMQEEYQTNSNFVARVGLLLCDQLALEGALALGNKVTGEEQGGFDPDRLVVFTGVLARLMQSNSEVAPVILDSLSLQIKTVTKSYVEDVKSEDAAAPMDVDGEEHPELAKNDVVTTRLETELDFVLTLCHCMHSGVCGMDLGSASSALPKLMDLTTEVSQAGYILRATLPTLLRLWSLSGRRASNIEGHITKCIDQMTEIGDSWAAYKVASEAAAYGFWSPACALFDALVKKVHSEGCYLWLSGLSHVAKAEAALKVDPARAIPLLRQVGRILAAGVCSERTFEFQRWLISIRLRMVQSVADLLHILSLVLSDGEILSALRTARERASGISTQLMHLGKEVDLLGLSFLGLDEESLERLREASVSCSLLAFCTEAVFSSSDEDPSIVRDLYVRVKHVESLQALLQCEDVMNGPLMGGCSLNSAVVRVCDWAITVINKLQRGASDPKQQDVRVEALHFLRLLIGECLQLPCSIPRYFFCTRPRAAVELFVAQTGGEELSELCVKQGSSLILSICAQLTNEGNSSKVSSLFCVVTFQGVESTSHVEEDLYADWKLGWHEGQAVDHPLVEKLVQRAKCEDVTDAVELEQELVSLPTAKEDTHYSSKKRSSGRSFAVFLMDKKGKGFSSCNLDVSAFPSGQYQLSFDCVGVDTNNKPWLLLPSRIHPSETLKITSTG